MASRLKEIIIRFYSALVITPLEYCIFWVPNSRSILRYGRGPSEGYPGCQESIYMACLTGDREWDLRLLRLLKRRLTGNFIAAYNYLKASHKEEEG